jgi:hypothetical protein
MSNFQYKKSKVLLVEGPDDRRFFSGLLGILKIRSDFDIVEYEGESKLRRKLESMVVESGFRHNVVSLGITRDADERGVSVKLQSIHTALHKVGLSESKTSIVPTRPNLRIAAHIICDSTQKGRLEEMILEAVAKDWRTACVDDYWNCLNKQCPDNDVLPKDENKSQLAVFLAGQERSEKAVRSDFWEDGGDTMRLDFAAQGRYLNLDHPVYAGVKEFLLTL